MPTFAQDMKEHFLDNPDFAPFVVDFNQCVYLRAQPAQYSAPQLCAFGARCACQWHFPAKLGSHARIPETRLRECRGPAGLMPHGYHVEWAWSEATRVVRAGARPLSLPAAAGSLWATS